MYFIRKKIFSCGPTNAFRRRFACSFFAPVRILVQKTRFTWSSVSNGVTRGLYERVVRTSRSVFGTKHGSRGFGKKKVDIRSPETDRRMCRIYRLHTMVLSYPRANNLSIGPFGLSTVNRNSHSHAFPDYIEKRIATVVRFPLRSIRPYPVAYTFRSKVESSIVPSATRTLTGYARFSPPSSCALTAVP